MGLENAGENLLQDVNEPKLTKFPSSTSASACRVGSDHQLLMVHHIGPDLRCQFLLYVGEICIWEAGANHTGIIQIFEVATSVFCILLPQVASP